MNHFAEEIRLSTKRFLHLMVLNKNILSMKPTIDQVSDILKQKFSNDIISQEQQYDFTVITITKESLLPVFRFLYDDESLQFRYLTTACGIHYPDNEKPYAMMYQLHSLVNNLRIRFKIFTT